jgi:hypothetical protein
VAARRRYRIIVITMMRRVHADRTHMAAQQMTVLVNWRSALPE